MRPGYKDRNAASHEEKVQPVRKRMLWRWLVMAHRGEKLRAFFLAVGRTLILGSVLVTYKVELTFCLLK